MRDVVLDQKKPGKILVTFSLASLRNHAPTPPMRSISLTLSFSLSHSLFLSLSLSLSVTSMRHLSPPARQPAVRLAIVLQKTIWRSTPHPPSPGSTTVRRQDTIHKRPTNQPKRCSSVHRVLRNQSPVGLACLVVSNYKRVVTHTHTHTHTHNIITKWTAATQGSHSVSQRAHTTPHPTPPRQPVLTKGGRKSDRHPLSHTRNTRHTRAKKTRARVDGWMDRCGAMR